MKHGWATAIVACFAGGALLSPRTSEAAPRHRERPALVVRERLRESLRGRHRGAKDAAIREGRRLRALVTTRVEDFDPSTVTAESSIGLRIGAWGFERPVSSDPSWTAGRTHATFRVASDDPDRPGTTLVRASWSHATLRLAVRSSAQTPTADGVVTEPGGHVSTTLDAVVRIGDERVRLSGTAHGRVRHRPSPGFDPSMDLVRVDVAGSAESSPETPDTTAPVVTIGTPAAGAVVSGDVLDVAGVARDDRSITSLAWSIDDGPDTAATFEIDPMTVLVDDIVGRFTFTVPAPVTPGVHTLRVTARDAAGGAGGGSRTFTVPWPDAPVVVPEPALRVGSVRTSKWGAAYTDPNGYVYVWGYGTTKPTIVAGVEGAVVSCPNLALLADGTATTLHGDPSGVPQWSDPPHAIAGLADLIDVDQCSTNSASFALDASGAVWAWGDNSVGQLGDGTLTSHYPPTQVAGLPPIQAISAGGWHVVALDRQGNVWTWGEGLSHEGAWARVPHQVAGISNAVTVSASEFDRYVTGAALCSDGTLWVWGDATSGQLGGSATERRTPAFRVAGVSAAKSVVLGYNHVLLLLNDGTLLARGTTTSQVSGYWGELGDGTMTTHVEFAPVPGVSGVVQICAGAHTSHALLDDGTLLGWGENTWGTVGDGTKVDRASPSAVAMPK